MSIVLDALEQRLAERTARGLVTAVGAAIREGAIEPGTQLPPIRTVARQLGVSPTTVSSAWSLLARSGAIRSDGRRGTTVTDVAAHGTGRYRRALHSTGTFDVDLSTGVPDPALLPPLAPALRRLRAAATPASYLDDPALPELIDVLAADWPYAAQRFLITDGAMDAIDLIARTMLRFGDQVVVEHPGFPPILDLLEGLGIRAVGVPFDAAGSDPRALSRILRGTVAAVLVQPRAQNPTGISMSGERVAELAEVLADSPALIVEDDSAGAIAQAPAVSLGSWLPERTLHIRSFSKSYGPDLRLAAVSGSAELIGELDARRRLGQGWSSRLLQHVLLDLLTDDGTAAVVRAARTEYATRRRAAVEQFAARGIAVGGSDGINLWVPVEDETAAVVRLASQGIGVAPGAPFAVLPAVEPHIRVTAGLLPAAERQIIDQIADAARIETAVIAR